MNFHRKTSFIVLFVSLLFAVKAQAHTDPILIEKDSISMDSILKEFRTYIENHPETNSDTILNILKAYDGWEITTQDTKYDTFNPVQREIVIMNDLYKEMVSILDEHKHPEPVKEQRHAPQIWIWILKNLAWIIALAVLFVVFMILKSKIKSKSVITNIPTPETEHTDIVVRRKTTSILRKQSLEDVIDNDNYMKIDCQDFCADSAVRRMYIKNTCIKDIYNMYAEDLRNPDKPKEDGCMVLGRWVYDKESDEYYVSLEHIVLPGDDAVFAEYELNFGGKIKMKVRDRLKKLRQETEMQYDLTCWVHSHPGLGVFFSNSDCNVQTQLKHPTHPRFLTAIVIDILTPEQELGIFTFKHDGEGDAAINSKAELTKMYSLEEWYKWAVENGRNSFKPEDHYNTLSTAKAHIENCHGIELSNGAIIDIGLLVGEQREGFIGTVHGFVSTKAGKTEHVATKVTASETEPDNEPIGCFMTTSHCSIPSIRKALADKLSKIGFVLVYTTADGLLTSIPVINNDLCTDQNFYGEQQLEELKIWTRRKR